MACTTILVGKNAGNDGSTMIARNDDGHFDVKKLVVVEPKDQVKKYTSKIGKLTIEDLPENPLRYTMIPNVDTSSGVWPASGVNAYGVGMTATETITSNPRVKGADPYVVPHEENGKQMPGGLGEEDLVLLVLPYIRSAREGVERLGALLEKYGTYEPNGIAFNDPDEIWWLETIGGHHWIARRVPDDAYVMMPNQFGLDNFDFEDAYGAKKENMCSPDLREFVEKNHLALDQGKKFNPRLAFGSKADSDHVYNTPRAWYMMRYFNPRTFSYDGPNARYTPMSDDIPWSMVPESKITVEDVKYILSSYYQGTPYDPYSKSGDPSLHGIYRPIGISRTSFMTCLQARPNLPREISTIEWLCMGANPFNAFVAIYPNVGKIPSYFSGTKKTVDSNSFYWANRLIGALADSHFHSTAIYIERYQNKMQETNREHILRTDKKYLETKDLSVLETANQDIASSAKRDTDAVLREVLNVASNAMKCGYSRSDN